MAKQITEYELLVSCPSDVKEELQAINETVEVFNRVFGEANNAKIVTKHWSKDSYPQSGGKPQKLLNEQFVLNCDAAVAVFWTRFGTPTDAYGSGTEEEIEELLKCGKQIFLYFSDCPLKPSQIVDRQYEKVKAFKEKYKDRGVYWTYSSLDSFKKDFLNHLTLYFVKILDANKMGTKTTCISNLSIKGVYHAKLLDKAKAFNNQFTKSGYKYDLKEKVDTLIEEIINIKLPEPEQQREAVEIAAIDDDEEGYNNVSNGELLKSFKENYRGLSEVFAGIKELCPKLIVISDKDKERIDKYAKENNINLCNDFYYLGTLSKTGGIAAGFSYLGYSYVGTEEEKNKYKLLCKLTDLIDEYTEMAQYLAEIDGKVFIGLALCNSGTDYDEDIDIKLFLPKGVICQIEDIPCPGDGCLELANDSFEYIYKMGKTINIDEYSEYGQSPYIPFVPYTLGGKLFDEGVKGKRDSFKRKINGVFCYQFFSEGDQDILCYNQKYLKQNTNSFLPSYLVFNIKPDRIGYEINSKRFPNIIKGELLVEN